MEKSDLINLISTLSKAALNVPQNKTQSEKESVGSFKDKTDPKPPPAPQPKTQPYPRGSDAIIKMIHEHNELSRIIAEKNNKK